MVFTMFSDAQTHALTNSLTDGQTRSQYASGTAFQRCRRYKIIFKKWVCK